jgi:alpha-ketoglutarate-dependent taurine dioxygenase
MKIKLHENNWTILVEDLQLQNATKQEMNTIAKYLASNTVVVIKNQKLTLEDETRACSLIGNIEDYTQVNTTGNRFSEIVIPESDNKVIRVTGEKDEHGRPGVFGHVSELDWHANQTANEWRHPIIWLYGVKGTRGSRTSWINNIMSYNELSDQDKIYYNDKKLINGFKKGAYSEEDFGKDEDVNYHFTPNLVHTNIAGQTGLFFPFLQIHQIDGMTEEESREFIIKLRDHVLQEKYMYHHEWEDGDVVISEQWLGIHKRWEFQDIDSRLLHRIALDFSNADFNDIDHASIKDLINN